jgi:hypothetical protein
MSETLECPECGEEEFSWITRQIDYGGVVEEDGRRRTVYVGSGEVLNIEGNYECVDCHEMWAIDELVSSDKQETLE